MSKFSLIMLLSVLSFFSCKKKGSPGDTDMAPTNLTLNAVISTDNSGNVEFTAAATNAATYEYGYGNGIFALVPSGKVSYKYPASGTYSVTVTAKSAGGKTASKTIQVTVAVGKVGL
jgi:PKD repeat protein